MFFLRRIIKQLVLVFVAGLVIRKLLESSNPRAQRIGHIANRVTGNRFGVDATGRRGVRRRATART